VGRGMLFLTPVTPVPVTSLGRVHMTGIGGTGMAGVARLLLGRGVQVSGTDRAPSAEIEELAWLGAVIHIGHSAGYLGDADTLVMTSAIRQDNPELAEARRRGLPVLHRAAALASLMFGRQGIAVTGTHGKTTTTSMLTTVLRHCGADPSYVIGGILAETGVCAADGAGAPFVVEADESDGSFVMLSPQAAIVTCIQADHLDRYADLAQIEAAFAAFAGRLPDGGVLVACADDPGSARLADAAARRLRVLRYGMSEDCDYRVSAVQRRGMTTVATVTPGPRAALTAPAGLRIQVPVPGGHNALNAAAALALASELGYPAGEVVAGLAAYGGARRRMEVKGEADGVSVLDSYAHHPAEIAADLTAARELAEGGRVIVVFQPHLYSRTRIFAAEFGAALSLADEVIVLDIYAAREEPEPGVTGQLIAEKISGPVARFLPDLAGVPDMISGIAKPGDLVFTMGAGNVTALGPLIVAALRERAGAGP